MFAAIRIVALLAALAMSVFDHGIDYAKDDTTIAQDPCGNCNCEYATYLACTQCCTDNDTP